MRKTKRSLPLLSPPNTKKHQSGRRNNHIKSALLVITNHVRNATVSQQDGNWLWVSWVGVVVVGKNSKNGLAHLLAAGLVVRVGIVLLVVVAGFTVVARQLAGDCQVDEDDDDNGNNDKD